MVMVSKQNKEKLRKPQNQSPSFPFLSLPCLALPCLARERKKERKKMHRSAAKRLLHQTSPIRYGFRFLSNENPNKGRPSPRANYEVEQGRVLAASLHHVIRLGWSEAAMIAGARDVALSPSIVGAIPRKEAALVEYFMDQSLQKLIHVIDSDLQLHDLVATERIANLIKLRLQMQAPYISKWPQALSIQAHPSNMSTSFNQRAMLVDELCHASSNDQGSGVDWYLKRTVVGGIYSTTEIHMLTDNSTDFNDTWMFLNERVRDAFDLRKTFQEVQYFAEAVGAGLGRSFQQGFTKKGC